jgi:predicted aspartyl protease
MPIAERSIGVPVSHRMRRLPRWCGRPAIVALLAAAIAVSRPHAAGPVIALSYNANLAAIGFPSPVLRATVNGQAVWFLVDTGASVHTLASWFATATHLGLHDTKTTVVGSTGATSKTRSAGPIQLETRDGGTITVRDALVADFPQTFADQHIGGLISPQLLAPAGQAVILNLSTPSLSFAPFDGALATLGLAPSAATASAHVCPTGGPPPGRTYGASVTIAGITADMTTDTGATVTSVGSTRVVRALTARSQQNGRVEGIGGGPQAAKTVAGVTIVRGGAAKKADVVLGGTSAGCGADGLLGMDVLRGCTLVLGEKTMAWSCGGS